MTTDNFSLTPGTVLRSADFNYTIEAVLGQGGFGITYLATAEVMVGDIPQEFRFAIKEHFVAELCERDGRTLRVEYSRPVADKVERSRRDFIREANRLKKLGISHPNIVRINEIFEANNTAYYVMQYLGDTTLQSYVRGAGRLSLGQTRTLLEPVMEAVAMLHDNRVAHYDIKPGNIMLHNYRGSQRPVLIDFGLAKHYDADGNATSTIGSGGFSPGYAPIEQTGALKEFSPRCDVYALAATIYFCLTGQRPPESLKARPEHLRQALESYAPRRVVDAILRGMATLDYNRTPDVRTLAREVFGTTPAAFIDPIDYHLDDPLDVIITDPDPPRRFIQNDCPPAPTTYGPPAPPEHKNSKWWLWLIVAVAIGAGIGSYFLFFNNDQANKAEIPSEQTPSDSIPFAEHPGSVFPGVEETPPSEEVMVTEEKPAPDEKEVADEKPPVEEKKQSSEANIRVSLTAPAEVEANKNFSIQIDVYNSEVDSYPKLNLDGCKLIYGPTLTTLQSNTNVGGKFARSTKYSYGYMFKATKTSGTIHVPAIPVSVQGKTYYTEAKTIKIKSESKPASGTINGHEYVDLGLPSGRKWATCNVGASRASDCGSYFAWGETTPKSSYTASNSKMEGKSLPDLKEQGIVDKNGNLNPAYDAARRNWGGSWRMPTQADFVELISQCTWKWTSLNGHHGYQVTGPNGNYIFLPAAGYRSGSALTDEDTDGMYWSSDAYDASFSGAYSLYFDEGKGGGWGDRRYGRSLRPVSE